MAPLAMSSICCCLERPLSDSDFKSVLRLLRKTEACVPSATMQISSTPEAENALTLIGRLRSNRIMASALSCRWAGSRLVDSNADEIALAELLHIGGFVLDLVRDRVWPFVVDPSAAGTVRGAKHFLNQIISVLVLDGNPQLSHHHRIGAMGDVPTFGVVHERIKVAIVELLRRGDCVEGRLRTLRGEFLLHALDHGDGFLAAAGRRIRSGERGEAQDERDGSEHRTHG